MLVASTVAGAVAPVTRPEIAVSAYTGTGMSCWQLKLGGACAWKNCVQAVTAAGEASDAGTTGNPMLQLGGEQDAVTEPEPGDGGVSVQDCVHAEAAGITWGCDAVQVSGILLSTTPPLVFNNDVFPITSVKTAVTVCAVPLAVTKLV